MNPVIHLVLRLIIGLDHGLVHISDGMILDFSYFIIKRLLSNISSRKQTGISIYLALGVTLLASTTEIQLLLYYKCTVGVPVWSSKSSMYLWITLVFLTALYIHIISPSVESDAIASLICTFQQTATPSRVWIIPETDRLLLRITEWSAS